ncbi:MAG: exopolysaccharide biosynthesis protein [Hyphomicrobiales bacterium]|nr:MAG: exopolysaccharide biosynthesis protein [Hyphomicrobiales bacterium]
MIRDQSPVPVGFSRQQSVAETQNGGYPHSPQPEQWSDTFNDERVFDPLKLLWLAVHYRWLIVACILAGLASGLFFTWQQTPLYRATNKIEISSSGAKVIQDLEVVTQANDSRKFETARQKFLSYDLAKRIVLSLNLAENKKFLVPVASFSLRNLINRATGSDRNQDFAGLSLEDRSEFAIRTVKKNLSARIIRNTSIIAVSYVHPDSKLAALIANQAALSFIDQGVENRSETSDLTRQFIQEQVIETKKKLEISEKELVAYARKAGITLDGSNVSLISANIAEVNKSLGKTISERLLVERYVSQAKSNGSASLPQVFKSQAIQQTKNKITQLKATYQEKRATLKPEYQEMRSLQAQIDSLSVNLDAAIANIGKSVEIQYEQVMAKEKSLREELLKLEEQQSGFLEKNIDYTILKREVGSNRSQYEILIGKLNEIGVGSDLKTTTARIVDKAQTPTSPFTPRLGLNIGAALALFSGLSVLLIYGFELMNNTFSIPDQIEDELGLPVLGMIPRVKNSEIATQLLNAKSPISEAYRTLRTSIQFTGAESNMKSLLVTSSEQGEGKSTTVHKLAEGFADLGKNVLVIDADLRKPRMHQIYKTSSKIGLSNLLSNVVRNGNFASIFQKTSHPNITFLSAGTIPPNPANLLASEEMGLTLHLCTKKYDLVIIDSPPIMGLADAPILSRQVDAVLLVVSSKQVARKSAKHAVKRLKSIGAHIVGATLNKFSIDKIDYNYAYRYMSYNYYSYETEQAMLESAANKPSLNDPAAISNIWGLFARRTGTGTGTNS